MVPNFDSSIKEPINITIWFDPHIFPVQTSFAAALIEAHLASHNKSQNAP